MAWMIFLFAVGTHQHLPSPDHRYQTEAMCKEDAFTVTRPGVSYAICRRVPDAGAD